MQKYVLSEKQCTLGGYLRQETVPVHNVEVTREEIEKIKKRAISCLGTYTPSEAKLRVDAKHIKEICDLALKVKPKRFKLRIKKCKN
jgi:hypothetical protein